MKLWKHIYQLCHPPTCIWIRSKYRQTIQVEEINFQYTTNARIILQIVILLHETIATSISFSKDIKNLHFHKIESIYLYSAIQNGKPNE